MAKKMFVFQIQAFTANRSKHGVVDRWHVKCGVSISDVKLGSWSTLLSKQERLAPVAS